MKRAGPAIAAGLIAIILAGGAWWYTQRIAFPSKPSIAVMPFEDIGGDASSDRLAHGIATDIATDNSRLRDLDVIASSATAAYGKKGADARQIAKDLNVRYVLLGTIQREGQRFEVARNSSTGRRARAFGRIDGRPVADVFAVQNEVADGVIATLGDRHNLLGRLTAAAATQSAIGP